MHSQLNLLGGFRRDVAVQRMTEHLETTCWPSVLSETIEELLMDQGYDVEQVPVKLEKLRDSVEERDRSKYVDGGPITLLRQLAR